MSATVSTSSSAAARATARCSTKSGMVFGSLDVALQGEVGSSSRCCAPARRRSRSPRRSRPRRGTSGARSPRRCSLVAAPALADVVQQDGEIELAAREQLGHDRGRDRQLLGELAVSRCAAGSRSRGSCARPPCRRGTCCAASGRRCGRTRARSGRARRPRSSASASAPDRLPRAQHLEEQPVGLGVGAQPASIRRRFCVTAVSAAGGCRARAPGRSGTAAASPPGRARRDPRVAEIDSRSPCDRRSRRSRRAAEAEPPAAEARLAPVLVLERGAEDPGQGAHLLGDQIVALHEALDAARAPGRSR